MPKQKGVLTNQLEPVTSVQDDHTFIVDAKHPRLCRIAFSDLAAAILSKQVVVVPAPPASGNYSLKSSNGALSWESDP